MKWKTVGDKSIYKHLKRCKYEEEEELSYVV